MYQRRTVARPKCRRKPVLSPVHGRGCSGRPVASPMYQRKRVFSAVASSAPSFQQVSSKICSFCSCVILDGTCRVADELGVEEWVVSTRNGDWCGERDGQLASVCPKARSKPIGSWSKKKKGEGSNEAAAALSKQ